MKKLVLPLVVAMLLSKMTVAQTDVTKEKMDSAAKAKAGKIKPFKDVITENAITDDGLFKVHKIDDRYFFEIPDSVLNLDILIVNRISKAAAEIRPAKGMEGYAGDVIGSNIVRFSKGPNNKLFIRTVTYNERALDSSENGMFRSVSNSSILPIAFSFDIKAYGKDSCTTVIDVTDFFNGDNTLFFFSVKDKKDYRLGGLQGDKSYIEKISSFPINLEISTIKTYAAEEGTTATYELNSSVVLLPKKPMRPRYWDERVGYFGEGYYDFDIPGRVKITAMINRWRLEPKDEDWERYWRGELVEPKTPIVYYIDPATPKKWVPYLIQGVNDWQKAFEKAGFKNAIYALEAPVNDPEFSLLDARHNAIIYKPSLVSNASGPHISDPRTGEILETHINWYHNITDLLQKWYMVQVGPNDPRARTMNFDDKLMGTLIRFVACHEVGHTLGLAHNFGASSEIPVEKLRDKKWVEENGFCPSIMDYARFNYVAQPEDHISENGLLPRIGVYDEWAIEWGYKIWPEFKTKEEEINYVSNWTSKRLQADARLWYGPQPGQGVGAPDPRAQNEDLGDDAMKAGYYGIKNLKRVLPNLVEWTKMPGSNYSDLTAMSSEVSKQYERYVNHVLLNIGTQMWTKKTVEQPGTRLGFNSKAKQKEAVKFLMDEVFTTPTWLADKKLFALIGMNGFTAPGQSVQARVLKTVLSGDKYIQMDIWAPNTTNDAYTFNELLDDLEQGIFSEVKLHKAIDVSRRILQETYIKTLTSISWRQFSDPLNQGLLLTDFPIIVDKHLKSLLTMINSNLLSFKDPATILHLKDMQSKLKEALEPNKDAKQPVIQASPPAANSFKLINISQSVNSPIKMNDKLKCWSDDLDD